MGIDLVSGLLARPAVSHAVHNPPEESERDQRAHSDVKQFQCTIAAIRRHPEPALNEIHGRSSVLSQVRLAYTTRCPPE
jgi:hypothetical protein